MVLAVAHPWASASSYLSSQSVADSRCNPHATPRSSYSRRSPSCRFFLCRSALLCLVLQRHRRLSVPCSRGFSCLSAQFRSPRGVFWSLEFIKLSSRKEREIFSNTKQIARTTLLTPTPIICRHVMLLLRSTLSSITCAFMEGVGTGVPFGYVVTARGR